MSDSIDHQLNRIEGQVRGIRKMLEEKRDCMDVLQQVIAVRASLATIGIRLVNDDLRQCCETNRTQLLDKKLSQLFKLT